MRATTAEEGEKDDDDSGGSGGGNAAPLYRKSLCSGGKGREVGNILNRDGGGKRGEVRGVPGGERINRVNQEVGGRGENGRVDEGAGEEGRKVSVVYSNIQTILRNCAR